MRRLLGVELTRLRWRRAVLLLVATAVVLPAVIWGATAWNTRPVSAAEQARAEQMVEQQTDQPGMQRQLKRCQANPDRFGLTAPGECQDALAPQVSWFVSREPLDLDQERGAGLVAVVTVLAVLLLMLGTTFVGHDWNSGSMSNQLLFEPRRGRVWSSKAVVVLLAGAVLSGLVLTAYWTGLWALADARGLDPTGASVTDGYQLVGRGTVFAAAAGLGGYGLTMLFRSTVATLGVLFAVSIVGPLLITLLAFPGNERWMPQNNVLAFVQHGMTYYTADGQHTLSFAHGTAYLLGLLVLATVPSLVSFSRRDVP